MKEGAGEAFEVCHRPLGKWLDRVLDFLGQIREHLVFTSLEMTLALALMKPCSAMDA
jgi:hypothetical protein